MNFNSFSYFLFLPVMLLLYFLLPRRLKNPALLAASYLFYMGWGRAYALLLLLSSVTTWLCGLLVEKRALGRRKSWIAAALAINFGILFLFKYFNFFADIFTGIFGMGGERRLDLLLPVGISFYTFQSAGYIIDVYRGSVRAERNFFDYALFVSFFPLLAAGPIERAGSLLPQLRQTRRFSDEDFKAGVLRFLWGLMKKMILADQLAIVADTAFDSVRSFNGGQLVVAAVCFSFQIYCDFSAYSDMAIGSARMLGVRLTENFRFPYGSRSIKEFWRRWHISLSSWFRDYLYFPLGGSRTAKWRHCLNVLTVFAVSGLWHGAAVTFVLWGLIHGLYQVAGIVLKPLRDRLYKLIPRDNIVIRALSVCAVFVLTASAWVFFRARSIGDAVYVLKAAAGFFTHPFIPAVTMLGQSRLMLAVTAFFLALLWVIDALREKHDLSRWFCRHDLYRYGVYVFLILSVLIFGYYGDAYDAQQFVYFRF
ncbi:MAG: MBOAT family protein [Oscillospiraceae bacterium]|jgi:D-alanyl-lipoteichoic acid acyltransferase DltB (MBOAT superfamily)|nr:MBOAT family protein [Oscillospiraceae bacterium]